MRLLLAILPLVAAHAQKAPNFKTDVQLVRLLVNVKNASGELVGSLEKEQFSVYDCNVAQEIRVFERYTTKPLSVAVLVDTSGSTAKDWQVEVRSLGKFLKALFGEGNQFRSAAIWPHIGMDNDLLNPHGGFNNLLIGHQAHPPDHGVKLHYICELFGIVRQCIEKYLRGLGDEVGVKSLKFSAFSFTMRMAQLRRLRQP